MIRVCPSTNPCPEDKLVEYVKELQSLGVEMLHCDVMDGYFVPAKCLSLELLKEVSKNTLMALDVHLMISNPKAQVKNYLTLPLSYLTIHYEAFENKKDMLKVIEQIHNAGKLAGISIKPNTNVEEIEAYLPYIDLVLVMSVEPGKSGQKFMLDALDKIKALDTIKKEKDLNFKIEIDGGINLENAEDVVMAGAQMLVMGNAFYNTESRKELLEKVENLK